MLGADATCVLCRMPDESSKSSLTKQATRLKLIPLNLVSGGLKKLKVEALILVGEMNKTFIKPSVSEPRVALKGAI